MRRTDLAAISVVAVAILLAIVLPIYIVSTNSTERLRSCVESGGAYVQVAERTTMECRQS